MKYLEKSIHYIPITWSTSKKVSTIFRYIEWMAQKMQVQNVAQLKGIHNTCLLVFLSFSLRWASFCSVFIFIFSALSRSSILFSMSSFIFFSAFFVTEIWWLRTTSAFPSPVSVPGWHYFPHKQALQMSIYILLLLNQVQYLNHKHGTENKLSRHYAISFPEPSPHYVYIRRGGEGSGNEIGWFTDSRKAKFQTSRTYCFRTFLYKNEQTLYFPMMLRFSENRVVEDFPLALANEHYKHFDASINEAHIRNVARQLATIGDYLEADKTITELQLQKLISFSKYASSALKHVFNTIDVVFDWLEHSTKNISNDTELEVQNKQKKEGVLRGLYHIVGNVHWINWMFKTKAFF